ncbi:hypothetical protein C8J57DRAFT_1245801 [Mycena rebaudengoi]|nr:hypothetical protein C8J57DRAFT_1245801 [Mycena rebaudengoi]
MPKGQFTGPQKDHIESFFPDYVKEMDNGVVDGDLTKWKQSKASKILESPLFATLDFSTTPRKTWFEMIVRKFTNYRNQVYLKSKSADKSTPALAKKRVNPLHKFSSVMSCRQLSAHENSQSVTDAVQQRMLDTNNKSPAAVYQNILKEKWDGLNGEEQASWNDRTEKEAGNVSKGIFGLDEVLDGGGVNIGALKPGFGENRPTYMGYR